MVSRVMRRLRLDGVLAWGFARAASEREGLWRLTFADLRAAHPFPAWLICRKIPWVHKASFADLQRRFKDTRLFKAFALAESDAPAEYQGGRFGLVFEWLHVWPVAVVHSIADAIPTDEPAIVHTWPEVFPPQLVAVQSFDSFLRSLDVVGDNVGEEGQDTVLTPDPRALREPGSDPTVTWKDPGGYRATKGDSGSVR